MIRRHGAVKASTYSQTLNVQQPKQNNNSLSSLKSELAPQKCGRRGVNIKGIVSLMQWVTYWITSKTCFSCAFDIGPIAGTGRDGIRR